MDATPVEEQKYLVALQLKHAFTIQPAVPSTWQTFPLKALHATQHLSKEREWFNEVTSEEVVFETTPIPPAQVN